MCSPRLAHSSLRLLLAVRAGPPVVAARWSDALSLAALLSGDQATRGLAGTPAAFQRGFQSGPILSQRSFASGHQSHAPAAASSEPGAADGSDAWGSRPRWVKGWKSIRQQRELAQGYKAANAEIRRTRDVSSLLLLTVDWQHLSPINVLTLLSKLVALRATDPRTRRPKQERDQIIRLTGFLGAHVAAGAAGYSPQQLADSLFMLRKLRVRLADSLLEAVEAQVTLRKRDFSLRSLAAISLVQAVARRGHHRASLEVSEQRVAAMNPKAIDISTLTDLAWCFSSLGQPSEPVLAALCQRLSADVSAFSGTQLSTAVWAAHVAGCLSAEILEPVMARVLSEPRLLKPGQQASFLHAVASTGSSSAEPVMQALRPGLTACAQKLNPQQLALVAGAFVSLKVPAPDLLEAVAESLSCQLGSCRPENLSRSLWALAQSDAPPVALFEKARVKMITELPDMAAEAVAPAAWAYLKATGQLDPELWTAFARHLQSESNLLPDQQQALSTMLSEHSPAGSDPGLLLSA